MTARRRREALACSAALMLSLLSYRAIATMTAANFAALAGVAGVVVVLVLAPEAGLVVYATSLCFVRAIGDALGVRPGLRGLTFAILLALSLAQFALRRKPAARLGAIPIAGTFVGLTLAIGLEWSSAPNYGIWKAEGFALYGLLILLGITVFAGEKTRLRRMVETAAVLGVVFSVLGLYAVFSRGRSEWTQLSILTSDPIWIGRGLGAYALALLVFVETSRSRVAQVFLFAFILSILFLIFNTASKGPTFSLLSTVVLYFALFSKKPLRERMIRFVATAAVACLMFSAAPRGARDRYAALVGPSSEDPSVCVRVGLWKAAIQAFRANPLTGLGTGGFPHYYAGTDVRLYPHNLFLETACELGILGLGAISVFLVLNLRMALRIARSCPQTIEHSLPLAWGVLVFLFGFLNSLVSGDIATNEMLWFGSGYMWTAYTTYSSEQNAQYLKSGTQ